MPPETRLEVSTPRDFDLLSVVAAHGWPQLPPYRYLDAERKLVFNLRSVAKQPLEVRIDLRRRRNIAVHASRTLGPVIEQRVRSRLRYMLSLDASLKDFHAHCRQAPGLRWIADGRYGRFLRGEDAFEDMAKTLLTTNCTWRQTITMVTALVTGLGSKGTFPEPRAIAAAGAASLKDTVRLGYRAEPLTELAARADAGELDGLLDLPTADLEARLKSFRGFGTYASSSLLLIWGRHEHQIIDTWAMAMARQVHGMRKPTPARLRRLYASHGPWRGLVSWFDLNRQHFAEFPPAWLA